MEQRFHARGKLLLTSEFMILHGAKALAVPLRKGQSLELVPKENSSELRWGATYRNVSWFETLIGLPGFNIIKTSSQPKSENLVFILQKILEINPTFKKQLEEYDVITRLDFDPAYGFGSSSTLTSLLAQWAEIDPMQLHFKISRGSGYDVACARSESALLYQVINEMPVSENVDFNPEFADRMWLAYLGHKQDSAKSVAAFLDNYQPDQDDIDAFSGLTCSFLRARDVAEIGEVIIEHEKRLSELLDIPAVKQSLFPELDGYAKSLGAWGGDFVLLVTDWSEKQLTSYLATKEIDQVYAFNKLICKT